MKTFLPALAFAVLSIGALAIVLRCQPPPASTPVDVGKLVACVEGEVEKGDTDPVKIVEACPGATAAVVSDVLQTLARRDEFAKRGCVKQPQ